MKLPRFLRCKVNPKYQFDDDRPAITLVPEWWAVERSIDDELFDSLIRRQLAANMAAIESAACLAIDQHKGVYVEGREDGTVAAHVTCWVDAGEIAYGPVGLSLEDFVEKRTEHYFRAES